MNRVEPKVTIYSKSKTSKCYQDNLHDKDDSHDDDEEVIVAQIGKHIFLSLA